MDFDIGVNLFCAQFPEPEKIYAEALREKVKLILTGSSEEENEEVAAFVETHDCYGTIGIHPHCATQMNERVYERMRKLLQGERIVAIGECGLDYNRLFSTKEEQLFCLHKHLALAQEIDKPLFLHCREAEKDFMDIFQGKTALCERSVIHCYTAGPEEAKVFLDMGFHFGITGWLCDEKRGRQLREAVKIIPSSRLMIETDAPYLTPKNRKGLSRINVPQNIVYVLQELATVKEMDVGELRRICAENTRRFFRL